MSGIVNAAIVGEEVIAKKAAMFSVKHGEGRVQLDGWRERAATTSAQR